MNWRTRINDRDFFIDNLLLAKRYQGYWFHEEKVLHSFIRCSIGSADIKHNTLLLRDRRLTVYLDKPVNHI